MAWGRLTLSHVAKSYKLERESENEILRYYKTEETHTIQRLKMSEKIEIINADGTPVTPQVREIVQRQLYRIGKGWLRTGPTPRLLPGYTTVRESMLAIGRAEHWLYSRRAVGLPIDKSKSERAFKIRMRLEAAS